VAGALVAAGVAIVFGVRHFRGEEQPEETKNWAQRKVAVPNNAESHMCAVNDLCVRFNCTPDLAHTRTGKAVSCACQPACLQAKVRWACQCTGPGIHSEHFIQYPRECCNFNRRRRRSTKRSTPPKRRRRAGRTPGTGSTTRPAACWTAPLRPRTRSAARRTTPSRPWQTR
jgi:hypothetical protein